MRTKADDSLCAHSSGNHHYLADAPPRGEQQLTIHSALTAAAAATITNSLMLPAPGEQKLTIHSALIAAAAATITNSPMPPARRTKADDSLCAHSSSDHHCLADAPREENKS
jgi:hypothetical protein